ncbi:hypothetical protein HYV73_04855 [Candidatus Uhrbacteria bacterium]|nr:hypothetical protein [Candidatus Uhrbacteria bacterium]
MESLSTEEKKASHEIIRRQLDACLEITKHQPLSAWAPLILRQLRAARRHENAIVARFVDDNLPAVLDGMRLSRNDTSLDGDAEHVHAAIEEIANAFSQQIAQEAVEVRHVPLVDIAKRNPDRFAVDEGALAGEDPHVFARVDSSHPWCRLPVPKRETVMGKGGVSRIILKIHAGAAFPLLKAELPPNDFDLIACGDRVDGRAEAKRMGIDPDGVEWVSDFSNMESMLSTRDVDVNQAFVTNRALVCSEKGFVAAQTGRIKIQSAGRDLYGNESFYFDGMRLVKNRGMYRLVKFLAEGKASSFLITPLNMQVKFGIYWLITSRKNSRKPGLRGRYLNRLHAVARKLNQVLPGEETIYDSLDRVHGEYPFFTIDDPPLDDDGVARWLSRKLFRLADRSFRMQLQIANDWDFVRHEGDDQPVLVHIDDYVENPPHDVWASEEWGRFVLRCKERNRIHRETTGHD